PAPEADVLECVLHAVLERPRSPIVAVNATERARRRGRPGRAAGGGCAGPQRPRPLLDSGATAWLPCSSRKSGPLQGVARPAARFAAAHPRIMAVSKGDFPDERAQHLLRVLVDKYIREGQPVGSRTLSRDSGLDLSPATIRNIMADLEEMGFVTSPHTSAG